MFSLSDIKGLGFACLVTLATFSPSLAGAAKSGGTEAGKSWSAAKSKPAPAAPTFMMPIHPKVDTSTIHTLYLHGDFDEAIAILEGNLKETRQYLHDDSVFIFKHLGVMHAARYETREKGKLYMHKLLMVEPTAKIMDMYASDMIYMIFKNMQDEFQTNRVSLEQKDDTVTGTSKTQPMPQRDTLRVGTQKQDGHAWLWVGAATVTVAAGVVAFVLLNDEQKSVTEDSKF